MITPRFLNIAILLVLLGLHCRIEPVSADFFNLPWLSPWSNDNTQQDMPVDRTLDDDQTGADDGDSSSWWYPFTSRRFYLPAWRPFFYWSEPVPANGSDFNATVDATNGSFWPFSWQHPEPQFHHGTDVQSSYVNWDDLPDNYTNTTERLVQTDNGMAIVEETIVKQTVGNETLERHQFRIIFNATGADDNLGNDMAYSENDDGSNNEA